VIGSAEAVSLPPRGVVGVGGRGPRCRSGTPGLLGDAAADLHRICATSAAAVANE